jgi:hypothetical protein
MNDSPRLIERAFPLKQASLFLPLPVGRGRAEAGSLRSLLRGVGGAGEGPP